MQATHELIERHLGEMVQSQFLNEQEERILRLRYGVGNVNRASFKEMMRMMNIGAVKLKKDIQAVDRKVFNYIKNKI